MNKREGLEKRLATEQKIVDKWSDMLFNTDFHNTSIRRRANLRIKLDEACEQRDETLRLLRELDDNE